MPFSLTASKTLAIVVLSLIHSMLWVKTSLIMLYGWLYLLLSSPFKHKGTKTEMIQRDAKQLQKIPLHLAIVISEPQIVYVDLAKMINWAFSLGVQFVSVYDMKGEIKRHINDVKIHVEELYHDNQNFTNQKLIVGSYETVSQSLHSTGNCLIVLSEEDGFSRVIDVATEFCREAVKSTNQSSNIDVSHIDQQLSGSGCILEPNLAIICGNINSLMGYPPWWTRLTEIMWLSSHHKISYQEFLLVIQRYATCQQRFGK